MTPDQGTARVVEASTDDLPAVARLLREAWEQAGPGAAGFAGATDAVIAEIAQPDALEALVSSSNRRLLVAWEGDRAVGFAATRGVDSETVELAGIIVLTALAGRGVGTALVERSIDICRAQGYGRMFVHTETTNEEAIRFYGRRGFSATGTATDDVDGTDVEVLVMERTLRRHQST